MFSLYCEEAQQPGQFRSDMRRIITQGDRRAGLGGGGVLPSLLHVAASMRAGGRLGAHGRVCHALLELTQPLCAKKVPPTGVVTPTNPPCITPCPTPAAKARIKDEGTSRMIESDLVDSSGELRGRRCRACMHVCVGQHGYR